MRRTNIWMSTLLTLLGVLLYGTVVSAQTIIVSHTYRGGINAEGVNYGINPASANYFIGDYRDPNGHACYPYCSADWRNFFVFDMSNIEQQIISARFEIFASGSGSGGPQSGAGYYSPAPSENFELHDVNASAADIISTSLSQAARMVIHTDLGSGVAYGNRDMTAADSGNVVSIELNSAAIAALNAATGFFTMGGSLTTLDTVYGYEFVFGGSGGTNITQLRLTVVPEPSTLLLLGIGAISLIGYRKAKSVGVS